MKVRVAFEEVIQQAIAGDLESVEVLVHCSRGMTHIVLRALQAVSKCSLWMTCFDLNILFESLLLAP